jgi:hypothetical protein
MAATVGVLCRYASDGRTQLTNLASIGQPSPSLTMRLDSVSDSPHAPRNVNVPVHCDGPYTSCVYTPSPSTSGHVPLTLRRGATNHTLAVSVLAPLHVSLTVLDDHLSAIGCRAGGGAFAYQSTTLVLTVDGLDMTHLSSFSSSDTSVAEVIGGNRVVGRAAGQAVISAYGGVASVSVSVGGGEVERPELIARVVSAMANASAPIQALLSESDVGYLYVYASYGNGDLHAVDADDLSVRRTHAMPHAHAHAIPCQKPNHIPCHTIPCLMPSYPIAWHLI